MLPSIIRGSVLVVALFALSACSSSTPQTTEERSQFKNEAAAAVKGFTDQDPSLAELLKTSDGFVIFPSITKGALIVGGSHGRGEVWEGSNHVGYAELKAATIGASFGGQSFAELIIFRTPEALKKFQSGNVSFDAGASAIAVTAGAAHGVKWTDDIAVLIDPQKGLMADASIGGQKFEYHPLAK